MAIIFLLWLVNLNILWRFLLHQIISKTFLNLCPNFKLLAIHNILFSYDWVDILDYPMFFLKNMWGLPHPAVIRGYCWWCSETIWDAGDPSLGRLHVRQVLEHYTMLQASNYDRFFATVFWHYSMGCQPLAMTIDVHRLIFYFLEYPVSKVQYPPVSRVYHWKLFR